MKQNGLFFTCFLVLLLGMSSCFLRPPTTTPMPMTVEDSVDETARLMLLLPGMGDRLGVFEKAGFHEVASRFPGVMKNVTLVELDAHFGYYPSGELWGRIKEDVLDVYPNHKVTVVGTSLGGFGAQLLARNFPDRIDHMILIAPYMGGGKVIRRVAKEGPELKPGDKGKTREALLNWAYVLDAVEKGAPRVDVLVGEDDSINRGINRWAEKSPQLNLISIPGGHKWKVWVQLWERWLEQEAAGEKK